MIKKLLQDIDPIVSVLKAMSDPVGLEESRKDILRNEIEGITIDTVCAFDTGSWETGIKINDEWKIAEQYKSKEEAVIGHKKYIKEVKAGKRDYEDIFMKDL